MLWQMGSIYVVCNGYMPYEYEHRGIGFIVHTP